MELKVIIVDDEKIILDGLCSFPWEKYGCQVVARAANGLIAIPLIERLKPDIVLSDIKMPEMDGLEFSERIKTIQPETEIILLTGYDSFEFAQQAIRIGVKDYLLKPVDYDELLALIARVSEDIRSRKRNNDYYNELIELHEKTTPMLKNRLTYELIHGYLHDRSEMETKLGMLKIKIDKYVVLTGKLSFNPQIENVIEPWLIDFAVLNVCEEVLNVCCEQVLCESDTNGYNFILSYSVNISDKDCIDKCFEACEKIQKIILEYFKSNICFGISDIDNDEYIIYEKYKQAKEACRQCEYLGDDIILKYSDIVLVDNRVWCITDGEKQKLFSDIFEGNSEKVKKQLKQLFTNCGNNIDIVRFSALELLIGCLQYSCVKEKKDNNQNTTIKEYSAMNDGIEKIYSCNNINDIEEYLKKMFCVFIKQQNIETTNKHYDVVKNIITYIEKHFTEDISLDDLSDYFRISKTYISRLLKKYTNKSFLEILLEIRMKEAIRLINENKFKISQIAEKVGYNDFSYFIQVFKKKFMVTPNEYRRIL